MNEIQSTELNQIEVEINFYKGQAVQSIFEIGERLIKAKELVEHGEWENWLNEKVDFSIRQAQRFIRVREEFPNTTAVSHLGQTKIFALLSVPQEERETFIEENPVEDMTTRELNQAIKEKKELEERVESYKYQQDLLREENKQLKSQEPTVIEREVTVEVVPDEYKDLKSDKEKLEQQLRKLKIELNKQQSSEQDFNKLRKEYENKVNESHDLQKQIEQLVQVDSKVKHQEKLKDSALMFSTKIHTFLNDVGGLAWLTEYIDDLDDYDKRSYLKALDLLEGWVLTVKSNINKEEF